MLRGSEEVVAMSDDSRSRFFVFVFVVFEAVFGTVDDVAGVGAVLVVVGFEEEDEEEGAVVVSGAEESVDESVPAESKFGLELLRFRRNFSTSRSSIDKDRSGDSPFVVAVPFTPAPPPPPPPELAANAAAALAFSAAAFLILSLKC